MQITQHVERSMPRTTPRMREALALGGSRREWEEIFDRAGAFVWDDAVLRVLESEARREEHRREQERKGIWCAPAPAAASVGRPHIFRALHQKNIGGVSNVSDVWLDADFYALDGVTGKVQSFVDYIDTAHLVTQTISGNQVLTPTADAAMLNALTGAFLGGQVYTSNRAAALFDYIYTSPSHAFTVHKPTAVGGFQVLLECGVGTAANRFSTYLSGSTAITDVTRGSTTTSATITSAAVNGTPMMQESRMDASANPALYLKSTGKTAATSATLTGTPATSSMTLTLGARTGVGLASSTRFRSANVFHHALNAAELAVFQSRVLATTGVPP